MAAVTTIPLDPLLDLEPWVGQRRATFTFTVTDFATGERLGEINPIREPPASLTHDTGQTIKRQLTINLGKADAAAINPISDRIEVAMKFPNGATYPLGRYMFTDQTLTRFTSGLLGQYILNDEMFLVDQEIRTAIIGTGIGITNVIAQVLAKLPIHYQLEASPFLAREAWGVGTHRGMILETLSVSGDYFSPWFDNSGTLRFIRSFNPANRVADLDFDYGNKVIRSGITETSNLLTAPNIIIVVSNSSADDSVPVSSVAYVSPNAPNSVARRGFEIPQTYNLQVSDNGQAAMVAKGLAERNTILETTNLTTAPDPRHDGYNVIKWQNNLWLELSWGMELIEGGMMNHRLRKAYAS